MSLDLSYIPNQELENSKINKDEKNFYSGFYVVNVYHYETRACLEVMVRIGYYLLLKCSLTL